MYISFVLVTNIVNDSFYNIIFINVTYRENSPTLKNLLNYLKQEYEINTYVLNT